MTYFDRQNSDAPLSVDELLDLAEGLRPSWMQRAECATTRARDFANEVGFETSAELFVPRPELGRRPLVQKHAALILCGDCSVRQECLAYALKHHPVIGTWGGKTVKQRNDMKKKEGTR
jgi:hypothetical protein